MLAHRPQPRQGRTDGQHAGRSRRDERGARTVGLDQHARDAVPTAVPPTIMLPFQANASVTVPAGAALPGSRGQPVQPPVDKTAESRPKTLAARAGAAPGGRRKAP
ncbi:MAG: hypothetical protein JWM02_3548 [Frankiales bacterium]|nr:hypothetical protein [Frankiales bacterium]